MRFCFATEYSRNHLMLLFDFQVSLSRISLLRKNTQKSMTKGLKVSFPAKEIIILTCEISRDPSLNFWAPAQFPDLDRIFCPLGSFAKNRLDNFTKMSVGS